MKYWHKKNSKYILNREVLIFGTLKEYSYRSDLNKEAVKYDYYLTKDEKNELLSL